MKIPEPGDWVSFSFVQYLSTWCPERKSNNAYKSVDTKGYGKLRKYYGVMADVEVNCGGVREVRRVYAKTLLPSSPPLEARERYEASYT